MIVFKVLEICICIHMCTRTNCLKLKRRGFQPRIGFYINDKQYVIACTVYEETNGKYSVNKEEIS